MKRIKKSISVLLVGVITMTSLSSIVSAEGERISAQDYSQLVNSLGNYTQDFMTEEDSRYYREKFISNLYPAKSDYGTYDFNEQTLMKMDIGYFGWGSLISPNPKDSKGRLMYLGYTRDEKKVTNVLYDESSLGNNPKQILNIETKAKQYTGNAQLKLTAYNDPLEVGNMYLPNGTYDQKMQVGREMQDKWIANMRNRLTPTSGSAGTTGYKGGADFNTFLDRETILNSMPILSPSTGRTSGTVLTFFERSPGVSTHRTMFIDNLNPVNFKHLPDYSYDQNTKKLTLKFEIEGDDVVRGNIELALSVSAKDSNDKTVKFTNIGSKTGELTYVNNDDKFLFMLREIAVDNMKDKVYTLEYDLSKYIRDEDVSKLKFNSTVNMDVLFSAYKPQYNIYEATGFIEYNNVKYNSTTDKYSNAQMKPYMDNTLEGILTAVPDLSINASTNLINLNETDNYTTLKFTEKVTNLANAKATKVDLYKNGALVSSQPITINQDNTINTSFVVSTADLSKGTNEFEAVVNSDRQLTVANPIVEEKRLDNNKAKVTINYINNETVTNSECSFSEKEKSNSYAYRVYTETGSYCKQESYDTKRTAEMQYLSWNMASDAWSTWEEPQTYARKNNIPLAKDMNLQPARDELMQMVGFNQLHQVLRSGKGIMVNGKIKVTGLVEKEGSYDKDAVNKFIEYLKKMV